MLKNDRLCNKLKEKKFVITVEISPPKGIEVTKAIEEARKLKGIVDAINITDSPMANMRMSPIALAHILQDHLNIETIFHLTCRDRNLIGLQSELLGAYALGVRNILALTGDSPLLGDTPQAKGVYDVDSIGLLRMIRALNSGVDYNGNKIDSPTSFCAGTTANPNDLRKEAIEKLYQKVEAGAEFIQTQPVYDKEVLFKFLDKAKEVKVPILVGVLPLKSYKMALKLIEKVPGIEIPKRILEKLEKGGKEEGLRLAVEFIEEIKDRVAGIHVMPMGSVDFVFEILSRIEEMPLVEKEVETK
ncbi:methylenetetrahydrofolate reductase [Caldanaerobacter sp.]|uniref:methylenetetrahydrofolate reductase n=1 Tax=Caldanaerobacter sp. TaxID=2930036 RepID=UPI003C727EE1